MAVLGDVVARFDPTGLMDREVLLGPPAGTTSRTPGRRRDRRRPRPRDRLRDPEPAGARRRPGAAGSWPGARVPYPPYVSPQPGWAEQDPEVWWRALGEACRRVLADPAVRPDALAGVALTTQRASVVVVDAAGDPLRPAIVWLDQRRTEGLPPVGGLIGLAFRVLGVRETVAAFQADAEVELAPPPTSPRSGRGRRATCSCPGSSPGGSSAARSTRSAPRSATSRSTTSGSPGARPGDWKWTVAPVDPAMLPELVPPGGRLGEITPAASAATGIPAGAAAHRGGRGQGLRGARRRRPRAVDRGPVVRHDGDPQHDPAPVRRGDPARPALSGGRARRLQPRAQRHARVLDGRVVQARVRRSRGRPLGGRGGRAGGRCSTTSSGPSRRGRWA